MTSVKTLTGFTRARQTLTPYCYQRLSGSCPSPGSGTENNGDLLARMHWMEAHPDPEVLLLLLSVEPTRALAILQPPSRADFQGWPNFQQREPWGSCDRHWASSCPPVANRPTPSINESALLSPLGGVSQRMILDKVSKKSRSMDSERHRSLYTCQMRTPSRSPWRILIGPSSPA